MITQKYIKEYIKTNYEQLRHCPKAMKAALNMTAKQEGVSPVSLFHLVIENEPMNGTHSYGFHTAYGRHLIDTFAHYYHSTK